MSVIVDKEIDHHRKGPDDYEFELVIDGAEVTLSVPQSEYYKHSVGDAYSFERYNGAFGVPFYISKNN